MHNEHLIRRLQHHARALAAVRGNLYRVRAYRQAAFALTGLPVEAAELVTVGGAKALARATGIGSHVAETLAEFVRSGQWITRDGCLGSSPSNCDTAAH